ncbi:inositol monophosphatase family protein [Legionella sp. W05-934-2]|jgi:myo-inositol-1(or 4)-monophosphatase|uniref:inositol monophosphatase family protein n=1 Tax=Legionella sp. W05-934-2 TaxID=1198649 RepID=UPI003461AE22
MHPLINIATTAARAAGDIIVRNMDSIDRIKISTKDQQEYFTEVDIKAEQIIIQHIHKAYPNHGIIAEESGVHNEEAETVWIIDPLDGTTNYLHGFPFFCVSIAVRVKHRIEHGLIYDPLRGECFFASRGQGAQMNSKRIRVNQKKEMNQSLFGGGFPVKYPALSERFLATAAALFGDAAGIRRTGSAALDLAYVACGRLDGYFEFGLRPWDMAAGAIIIKEAGGLVGDFAGGEDYLKSGNVVAANPKLFKAMMQKLSAKLVG